jgi:hypothetical protein
MNIDEAHDIVHRACGQKARLGPESAHNLAERMNTGDLKEGTGPRLVQAYVCPVCGAWHVGHLLSPEGMAKMADALRVLKGNGPGAPAGNIPKAERRALRKAQRSAVTAAVLRTWPKVTEAETALQTLGDSVQSSTASTVQLTEVLGAAIRKQTGSVIRSQRRRRR